MAVAAITNNIEHDIFAKFLAVFCGNARGKYDGFGVIPVDVEDRRFNHKGNIRTILTRTVFIRRRGKTNLVIDNHMYCPARAVACKLAHLKTFHDDTLAGKGAISVKYHRHNLFRVVRLISA